MMEILFRVWDKKNKEMIYDIQSLYDGNISPKGDYSFGARSFGEILTERLYFDSDSDELRFIPMQFTGLKDKNGKKIYEWDVIRILLKRHMEDFIFTNAKIVFENAAFWFNSQEIGFTDCNWHFYNQSDREVIGNICENGDLLREHHKKTYDNPELLEQKHAEADSP